MVRAGIVPKAAQGTIEVSGRVYDHKSGKYRKVEIPEGQKRAIASALKTVGKMEKAKDLFHSGASYELTQNGLRFNP